MTRSTFTIFLLALFWPAGAISQKSIVVASTEWTGAMACAAGADTVLVLAPPGLLHPAEYELTPGDVMKLRHADIIICGGYERMVDKLTREALRSDITTLKIDTINHPDSLVQAIHLIASQLGTAEKANVWEKEFRQAIGKARKDLDFGSKPVIAHRFQVPLCRWLGMNIVGIIGPGEPTVREMAVFIRRRPYLVIDNIHNSVGMSIASDSGAAYVRLINFPGTEGTRTLTDVFLYNLSILRSIEISR